MLAFLGAWSILEMVLVLLFIIPLAWATNGVRNGRSSPTWWILGAGFVGYVAYFMATSPKGVWFPPVFTSDFWINGATWWSIGKYLAYGVGYALIEMLAAIVEERKHVATCWNKELNRDNVLYKYVTRNEGDEHDLSSKVKMFCSDWNSRYRIVKLTLHPLDRVPQPSINPTFIQRHVTSWIVLWPAYLLSLLVGRFLDRIVDAVLAGFRWLGNKALGVIFNNTFKQPN